MLRLTSSDSVTTLSLERTKVLAALRDIAGKIIRENADVVSIRLFGSLARGDQVGTSDADILIVVKGEGIDDPLQRTRSFYSYFRLPVPVDLLIYSEAQLQERLMSGDPQFARLWRESIDLKSVGDLSRSQYEKD
jgi:predicted nucleotidyltransferase